jgi:hypothetical protein
MTSADDLRERALRCIRLAGAATDRTIKRKLMALAEELIAEAGEMEAQITEVLRDSAQSRGAEEREARTARRGNSRPGRNLVRVLFALTDGGACERVVHSSLKSVTRKRLPEELVRTLLGGLHLRGVPRDHDEPDTPLARDGR